MLNKEDLVNGREYLVSLNGDTLFLFYKNGNFYDEWQEFPFSSVDDVDSVEKSPNFDKKILISGTYGDPVVLYLDGYVGTKYGDYLRIDYVDLKLGLVFCHGDYNCDYSRISSSSPNNKESQQYYKDHFKHEFDRRGLREGSVIKHPESGDNVKVIAIRVPNLIREFDFYIVLEGGDTIKYNEHLVVISTPYTKEERVGQIIDKNTKFDGVVDKEKFIKEIIKFFDKQ
jgi:hypothetical protein